MMIISLIISHWVPRISPENSGLIFTCLHFLAHFQRDCSKKLHCCWKMNQTFPFTLRPIQSCSLDHIRPYSTCMQNATLMRQHCTTVLSPDKLFFFFLLVKLSLWCSPVLRTMHLVNVHYVTSTFLNCSRNFCLATRMLSPTLVVLSIRLPLAFMKCLFWWNTAEVCSVVACVPSSALLMEKWRLLIWW